MALDGGRGVVAPEAVVADAQLSLDGHDAVGLADVAPVGDAARGAGVALVAGPLARDLAVHLAPQLRLPLGAGPGAAVAVHDEGCGRDPVGLARGGVPRGCDDAAHDAPVAVPSSDALLFCFNVN